MRVLLLVWAVLLAATTVGIWLAFHAVAGAVNGL